MNTILRAIFRDPANTSHLTTFIYTIKSYHAANAATLTQTSLYGAPLLTPHPKPCVLSPRRPAAEMIQTRHKSPTLVTLAAATTLTFTLDFDAVTPA
ncbi:uncharacterized protein BKCO1_25000137 [Diplodia corticola]|uniref:Uncharacterized protein n=1 Tax=Diplodia corticola TaxID=236234 RepID=A0A1J9S3G2_9PEZI|nr:uncharacterized protein BKCO1_25000137 [Diplodia corticola]OJD34165.1 hypothetical protein BKCO1_25000137 [Diplodia corticola]